MTDEQKRFKAAYACEWRKNNPEKVKEHALRSREKNKEKIHARQSAWREANKEHCNRKSKAWYDANRDRVASQNMYKSYGITLDEYTVLLDSQGGVCSICGSDDPKKGNRFAVDHNHATGIVRGLLCQSCNVGIGHFRDDVVLLEKAITYLRHHGSEDR